MEDDSVDFGLVMSSSMQHLRCNAGTDLDKDPLPRIKASTNLRLPELNLDIGKERGEDPAPLPFRPGNIKVPIVDTVEDVRTTKLPFARSSSSLYSSSEMSEGAVGTPQWHGHRQFAFTFLRRLRPSEVRKYLFSEEQ